MKLVIIIEDMPDGRTVVSCNSYSKLEEDSRALSLAKAACEYIQSIAPDYQFCQSNFPGASADTLRSN